MVFSAYINYLNACCSACLEAIPNWRGAAGHVWEGGAAGQRGFGGLRVTEKLKQLHRGQAKWWLWDRVTQWHGAALGIPLEG